ncbi:MAG TPA: head GIN domain-containing protein [Chryseosolibacter sp.]
MTTKLINLLTYTVILSVTLVFASCDYSEDPGPLQEIEKEFNETDFDRLEMGDALQVDVEQGNFFEISVRGDRRNINDLEVFKEGSTLIVRFDEWENRRHETYVTITMPTIVGANFSGASNSRISGFDELTKFDLYLSGASTSQVDVVASEFETVVSGASVLNLRGSASVMNAEVTGASVLKAFNFPVVTSDILATGASHASITVADQLKAVASGASSVTYRGNPTVTSDVSGSSSVRQE